MGNHTFLNSKVFAHILVITAVFLAATSFPVAALITDALPPSLLMSIRFITAALLFSPYIIYKHGFKIPAANRLLSYCLLSIPLAGFFVCMFESLRYTTPVNTGALYITVPGITAIYALFINGEKTHITKSIGLLIGTLGALWVVFRGDLAMVKAFNLNYGDAIFLLGCLFMGAYMPLVKKLYKDEPMEIMTFWTLIFGAILLSFVSAKSALIIDWGSVDNKVYAGILYLSVFTTLVTFFLFQYCVVTLGPTKVSAYGFLTPMMVIIISVAIGLEAFNPQVIPGLALIFVAMLLIQIERSKNNTQPSNL